MRDYTTDSGCLGAWLFDKGSGGFAHGASTYRNTGTITGATWDNADLLPWSRNHLDFDGTTSHVSVSSISRSYPRSAISTMGWFKVDAVVAAGRNMLIVKDNFMMGIATANEADTGLKARGNLKIDEAFSYSIFSDITFTAGDQGVWQHVAFTRSGTVGKLYINGVLDNTDNAMTASDLSIPTSAIAIGKWWDGGWLMDGMLDEIAIFNRALTATEINEIYSKGLKGGQVEYLTTANATFMNLQSGLARPYWEVGITVSGEDSTYYGTLGAGGYPNNKIISIGTIDRVKPTTISGLSKIFAGNVNITLDNGCGTYSPLNTGGIFTDPGGTARDYMHSTINIWAGFHDTSGTAFAIQRGSFLLTQLRIDSRDRKAYIGAEDVAKLPLAQYVGIPGVSGTAAIWEPPSGNDTKAIITDLLSGAGLTATQYDIESGITFGNLRVTEKKTSDLITEVAQANDGYIYTNAKGQVIFRTNYPEFGGLHSTEGISLIDIKDSDRIKKLNYKVDIKNLINRVEVKYTSGTDQARVAADDTVVKGRTHIIANEVIEQPSVAGAIASETLGQFKENRAFLDIDNIWLPSIDIGDVVTVFDSNTYQTAGVEYLVDAIRENIVNCNTKISTSKDVRAGVKWGFCSESGVANCGTVFTDSWHSGFAFATVTGSAFDADGNVNNVVESGVVQSGAGTTGIELPFLVY